MALHYRFNIINTFQPMVVILQYNVAYTISSPVNTNSYMDATGKQNIQSEGFKSILERE